ncbi:MAG TPA: asparagine synthase (glutamine-hydrolyzing) [Thermoanaerobaculia bacterium]|nr:asparagine synthase (glutamine-hydrolyzing) [Thermoanaerobaculia bacterium]
MCGIFGAIGFELAAPAVRRALWSLSHRGPDDWGVWASDWSGMRRVRLLPDLDRGPWSDANAADELWSALPSLPVVLGHARLSILDITRRGHQPMEADSPAVLVFNGEIYNYRELRTELEALGHRFHGTGDAEVLLAACRAWGASAIPRLNGAFAFAVWDAGAGELLAARDRMGKKPLYLVQDGHRLAFASEIKALWEAGLAGTALDAGVAARYLALGSLPAGCETFFEGIKQLPPASFLRWRPGRAPEVRRYWEPEWRFDRTPADAPARLRELLAESVRLRYRSDVPVGVSLSGGIDSSGLLVASVEEQERVLAFSGVHEGGIGDERERIRLVLAQYPEVEATFLPTSEGTGYDGFLEFLALHDEPLKSDGIYNQFRFLRELRKAGIKVLLSGQGADELFLGYPWYIRPYLRWLLRSVRPAAAMRWAAELRRREGGSWAGLARGLASELSTARLEGYKRRQTTRWLREDLWESACAGPFRQRLDLGRSWPAFHAAQLELESLPPLLKDEDRNSMANGIETRLPYLDVHLVEWAATLAPEVNLRGGATKRVLREAFGRLPEEIVWSPAKRGFYVPYLERWPEHGEHTGRLLREAEWLGGWLDRSALQTVADRGLLWRAFNLAFAERNARRRRAAADLARVA